MSEQPTEDNAGQTAAPQGVVWITGASSGLGYGLALRYAADGYTVVASARREDKLLALSAESRSLGYKGKVLPVTLDVTDDASVEKAIASMLTQVGAPDIVVLNAGFYEPCSLEEISLQHFLSTYEVNVHGVARCLFGILDQLKQKAGSQLVLVSSVAGYSGLPRAAAYGSSKAALIHLAESLRHECEAYKIKITLVNPGFVKTPLTDKNDFPMPFIMPVQKATDAMYRGIQSGWFEVTFPRRFTWILKFLRILPYPVYFALTRKFL